MYIHKTVLLDEAVDMLNIKPDGIYVDATTGIEYYDEICKMDAQMSENPQAVVDKFTEIAKKVFCQSRLLIGFTGNAESYTEAETKIKAFVESLPVGEPAQEAINFELQKQPPQSLFRLLLHVPLQWMHLRITGSSLLQCFRLHR